MTELLDNRLTLAQQPRHPQRRGDAGAARGLPRNELGDQRSAKATRWMALELGTESGDAGIVGWAYTKRWPGFSLTAGNYRAVIPVAEAGALVAPDHSDRGA
jgi:hypothetical protein